MSKITYENKAALNVNYDIADDVIAIGRWK